MDERHWWVAGRVQETFQIGGRGCSPAVLEEIFSLPENLQLINEFLQAGGHQTLFFFSEAEKTQLTTWDLHIQSDLLNYHSLHGWRNGSEKGPHPTMLYFLRTETSSDIDAARMEREIFCGEIKENPVENLKCLLTELFFPVLRAQTDWGSCSQESVTHFLSGLDKYVAAIQDAANVAKLEKQQILKRPTNVVSPDFLQQRSAILDTDLVNEHEALVSDWIKTIDQVLLEAVDERVLDITTTPLTELGRWHRRQKVLGSIMEQLRGKECKTVIGLLISAKSRLLKKWKSVDISITDASNATKDRVKYLEALYRHFEAMANENDPSNLISSVLPALFNAIKQMETISRFFARNGYLGLLLTKVSNQLAQSCREYIRESIVMKDSEDHLWGKVVEHIENEGELLIPMHTAMHDRKVTKDKTGRTAPLGKGTLSERIQACLALHTYFQDAIRQLRECLIRTPAMRRNSSSSSLSTALGKVSSPHTVKMNKPHVKMSSSITSSFDHHHDYQGTGVPMSDEDTLLYHLETLCRRLKQFIDVILKLHQFKQLCKQTEGVRKPNREDLIEDEGSETGSVNEFPGQEEQGPSDAARAEVIVYQGEPFRQVLSAGGPLQTLIEEDEAQSSLEGSPLIVEQHEMEQDLAGCISDFDAQDLTKDEEANENEDSEQQLSSEEKQILGNLYDFEDPEDEGLSLSSIIEDKINQMIDTLAQSVDTDILLDIERREQNPFEEGYSEFLVMNQQLERYISVYIQALFLRRMRVNEALTILQRFYAVSHRQGIQPMIGECYMMVFDWFCEDLKEIQATYETFKEDPVVPRNMPLAAGAIFWSRQLLSRIEGIMKVFRDVRIMARSAAYTHTVKLYNRIATALVGYEALWYQKWMTQVNAGLSGLKVTLLVRNPLTHQLMVNTDMRLLYLIEETKWMTRLGIQVPEAAILAFKQGNKFKQYKSNLEDVLQEYEQLQRKIPHSLADLFIPHLESVNHQFQPGLTNLSWNSVNIEGLLYQANAAVARLRQLVEKVTEIKEKIIETTLEKITDFDFFAVDEIIAEPKGPEEFIHLMTNLLDGKKMELQNLTTVVHIALSDIILMLQKTKVAQPGSSSNVAVVKTATTGSYSRLHQTLTKAQKAEVAPSTNARSNLQETITDKVLEFFCNQMYEAVYISTCRSLLLLAHMAGCDMEAIMRNGRLFHPLKSNITKVQPLAPGSPNLEGTDKPHSFHSFLRDIGRGIHGETQLLRFNLIMRFRIPNLVMDPPLEVTQDALNQVTKAIISASEVTSWWTGEAKGQSFHTSISQEATVRCISTHVSEVVTKLRPAANNQVLKLGCYDFLWKDDMNGQCKEFLAANSDLPAIHKEVERFLHIKQQIQEFSEIFHVGCICLDFSLIKDTLIGFAGAWKFQYATILHQQVKENLQAAVKYREEVHRQLTVPVQSLEDLNSSLKLLEELQDMENKIDGVYQPIEDMYEQLRSYELRIPRKEVTDVKHLRDGWTELMCLASKVKETLLKEKQDIFKQELDKQVKSFVVEVIQFRNNFDTQGPAAPGVTPEEAVSRLHIFQEKFQVYDAKRKTLNSVQRLFNIVPKRFSELDRTGKDLHLLGTLYDLFEKFIDFDQRFRNTLWAEVDLTESNKEIAAYWSECLVWNDKLKDWDAYIKMAGQIKFYEDIFPLLHKLAAKEIRNRHWLQVMAVTGSSFPLEANVFKVFHLLEIGLLKFQDELVSIAKAARKELELEIQMRRVEEEWTEQVLNFEAYKSRGEIFLVKEDSLLLLEELEDAQVLLAHMLTSREIDPLREEATSWAEKLKRVGDVLELWIDVQELWQHLEEIFSHATITKELPREARRFAKVDRSWVRMMRSAFNTKNVVQCCCAGDVPKEVILKHVQEELEICSRSLTFYLNRMRQAFPRFYFLCDLALLSLLSHPWDVKYLQHHLRYLFSSVHGISVETLDDDELNVSSDEESVEPPMPIFDFMSVRSGNDGWMSLGQKSVTQMTDSETVFQLSPKSAGVSQEGPHSALHRGSNKGMTVVAVTASDGEALQLDEQVLITSGVEVWLDKLQNTIFRTMDLNIWQVIQDVNQGMVVDEWTQKYPTQVSILGLLYLWTKDCEVAISEMKQDRKALPTALKKYSSMVNRLSAIVLKGIWRVTEETVTHCHKLKLENMILHLIYLRDVMESFTSRKIREVTDFDWKRATRFYLKEKDGHFQHELNILDAQYKYGCEFYGARVPLIMNPTTEKCFLTISQAIQQLNGVALQGEHGVGKTETVKGLSYLLGKFLFFFTCSSNIDLTALSRVLLGTAMDGCWSCFDDFHLLVQDAVSVFMYGAQTIFDTLKAKEPVSALLSGQEIAVDRNCNLFLTVHWCQGFQELPGDVRAIFRTVSLCAPDHTILLKRKLTSLCFKSPKALARRLQLIAELVKEQLPGKYHHHFSFQSFLGVIHRAAQKRETEKAATALQNHMDIPNDGGRTSRSSSITSVQQNIPYGASPSPSLKTGLSMEKNKKPLTSNPLVAAAKENHAIIADALQEVLAPRMAGDHLAVFKQIVRDVFAGMYDPSGLRPTPAINLEKAILTEAEENNLSAHSPWVNKVRQLCNLSQVHPGIIVAGPPGSGKSTCISALVQALNRLLVNSALGMQDPEKSTAHKLVKINPLSVDNFSLMFGSQTSSHTWVDGIVTYVWRRALRSHSNTWICFDGQLSSSWADTFNSVLGPEKVLQLNNGDHLEFTDSIKLLFETSDLHLASPATVTKAGILFLEGEVLGWQPLAKTWLDGRNQQENTVLSKAFYKTLDPILNFVLHDAKPLVPVTEVGLFSTCTNLLAAMLNDKAQSIGGQLHIERLFVFCLIWSVGGLLDASEMKKFNELIKVYTSVLPDYENEISVFDYYVDESGEWDTWQSRLPEMTYIGSTDILGEVFIPTLDTMIVRTFMEYASMGDQPVLLIGPPGSGKTAMINDFMNTQDRSNVLIKRMAFSGSTKASDLQQLIETNIVHRQGFIYGARNGKSFQMFIDDINLPQPDSNGVQPCNELLRLLLDDKVLVKLSKPFEWQSLQGLVVQAAMALPQYANSPQRICAKRLLRHFAIFHLPDPKGLQLQNVIFSILEANLGDKEGLPLAEELHIALVNASCQLLEAVKKALLPSPTPGRQHYLFSLRDINRAFQCLQRLSSEDREDSTMVVSFWHHELRRILGDRLSRSTDQNWFNKELTQAVQENFPDIPVESLRNLFVMFPLEMTFSHQTSAGNLNKGIKVLLQPVQQLEEVKDCLQTYLQHYNEELGHQKLQIELSENIVEQIIRIYRVLACEYSGNLLLIGSVGSHLRSLVKLSLYVADVSIHPMDTSGHHNFLNSLKSAIQLSAVEGNATAILLTAQEIADEYYLDAINSLLICGDYPSLFSTEEMSDLLQVLGPALRRKHPNQVYDPSKYLVSQVKYNLHLILCLPPHHELLQTAAGKYPGFLCGCQVIWIDNWSPKTIHSEASYYMAKHHILELHPKDTRENAAVTISQIHSSMLKECNQIPWVGSHREHKLLSSTDLDGDESARMEQKNLTDLPFAKDIIQERIQLLNKGKTQGNNNEVFLGPGTLRSFLESFKYIYLKKRVALEETEKGLRKVLETLAQTRIDAKETQIKISIISQEHEESEVTVIESFNKLIAKASALERLKAEHGIGGEILQVFLSQNESELEDDEDAKELLKEEEADEYDEAFWAMKEASSVSHIHEIIKKIEKVKSELEEVRSSLKNVKNQVMHWCRKVDKGCIERLLRCQNPPYLVGQVLEMVLVMVDSLPFGDNGVNPLSSTRQPIENADDKGSGQTAGSSTTKPVRVKRKDRGIGRDSKDKVDKAKWKSLQYRIGDSSKIIEMLLNVATLEDGLPPHTLKDVESYLGKTKDGLQGVTGEGSLLEDAAPHATPQSITPAKKYVHSDGSPTKDTSKGGITIASARYSSEDAATLVTFVVAVIEYTRLCGPLRDCLRRLSELEKEKEECSKEEVKVSIVTEKREEGPPTPVYQERSILTIDDLPTLEIEVQQLQAEYDVAVVRKHKLRNELHSHQERLQAALDVMKSLSIQEQGWKETVEQSSLPELLTNCIIAAAFLTYCTPLSVDRRKRVIGFLFNVCENCGLTIPPRLLLKDVNLMQFLHSPIELKKLEMKGLPQNRLALDNSCVLTNAQGSGAWVLVCDPTAQAIQWMKDHLPDACTEVQHYELRSHLDSCLTDGLTLLLTYCDTQILSKDARFSQVIRSKSEFIRNKVPFKMMVADHEVECHPGFHMYLHTTSLPQEIPPEVAAFCSILYFSQDNEGLVEQLLDRFVLKEKPRLKEEQSTLEQECLNNMEELSALERRMITTLQSDSTLLCNLAVTKKLSDLKQQHEEALEMKLKIDASQKTILHVREGFREIAVRGTVMFDTAQRFRQFNVMYQTSFSQLLEIFDLSVAHSERSSVKGVLAYLTHNIFAYVTKSLLEKDRLVYALQVTFEVEESLCHLKPGEKEFAIFPDLCVAVLQKLGVKPSESRHQAKNPFDWMTETQFKNVQILAMYYSWFGDLFDRMYRDGKDLTWKAFCESEQPEHPTKGRWPEGLDELTPLQRFLVLRAVRPDRSLQAASAFISGTLGKMYTTEFTVDLQTMSPQSPQRPSLLIYSSDSSIALKLVLELAERRNHKTLVFPITNTEEAEKRVKELLKLGMSEGCWVMLENIQNSINVMTSLEEIIKENKNPDKNFHLWISIQASPFLPVRLLHYTEKIVVDMPKSMKGGLMQSWQFVDPEAISRTRRPELPAILHNVCILHCAVRLRTEFGVTAGWNYPGMLFFGCTELTEALQLLTKEFKDDQESASGGQVVAWTAIRYLLSEVIYGRNVTDDCDATCLTSMIEYWISPGTTKKDLKYKLPAAFFNTDIHMASLMQSLDTIPQYTLDAPEVFHMHPSPAVPFGQEDYVFSHLRVLYDSVQFCKEWEQTVAQGMQLPQKRRTSMTRHPPVGVVKIHVAQTATGSLLRQLTMAELWEVCSSLITKIPRGWSRDTIMERLKILGGNTPFNLFIKKELEQLMSLLSEVRRNLQVIKNALESESTLGDQLSDPVMSVVNDLHHKRTPAHWCATGNNISYPPELSASAWMSEVQQRVAHFEKILHLGRDKMPSYWLGAFRNPKGLLSLLKQETIRQYSERTGNSEPIVFKTEITQRDKDHIRDPPHEGMFIYGIHIWGISWNKTDAELLDAAPRQNPCLLPVIHLHCMPLSEKTGVNDPMKASDSYACPVYISSTSSREPILHLDIQKENVPSSRWALRGLKATIHPF